MLFFNKIRTLLLVLAVMLSAGTIEAFGQGVRTVDGDFTFYGDANTTRNECMRQALEGARLQALAKEFGTTLSQVTVSDNSIISGQEKNYFSSLSETEVKGEWIEDMGNPVYSVATDDDGNYVVRCQVKGRAREISNNAPSFTASVLRNGTDLRHADTRFRVGDDMKLYFKAPVDGYLVVYMADENRNVSTLLPYSTFSEGAVKIKHGKEYVFFDNKLGDKAHGEVDEYQLVTDADVDVERDRIYILFSPHPFTKANDNYAGEKLPRNLPLDQFRNWLSKVRKADNTLGQMTIDIVINQ